MSETSAMSEKHGVRTWESEQGWCYCTLSGDLILFNGISWALNQSLRQGIKAEVCVNKQGNAY
jgi:hypothetical protein